MVYVLSKEGKPLMPTRRHGKVRRMLRDGLAEAVTHEPFTIRLLYQTETEIVQDCTLGVDPGYKTIGLSVTTSQRELYAGESQLREDIPKLLEQRREFRRSRRSRKIRHRKARFDNPGIPEGWLAPSVRHRVDCHIFEITRITEFLPVSKIRIEDAPFDIQELKNPEIQGKQYQHGEQEGWFNVRAYILHRDNGKCQICHGKSKDKHLHVHHIQERLNNGGNSPENLITLCSECHKDLHAGKVKLKGNPKGKTFRSAAFMGVVRNYVIRELQNTLDIPVERTFGYITSMKRIQNGLPKEHSVDARCISGNPHVKPARFVHQRRKIRCHNRQLFKANPLKCGKFKRNQSAKEVKGFRLFDKVFYEGQEGYISGKRTSGYMAVKHFDGRWIHKSASWKKLKRIHHQNGWITNRKESAFLPSL